MPKQRPNYFASEESGLILMAASGMVLHPLHVSANTAP